MRYQVGYYCPRGNGHYELYSNPDYDGACGSKGWPLILGDAHPNQADLPQGEWVEED